MSDFLAYDGNSPMVGDTETLAHRSVCPWSSMRLLREAISPRLTQATTGRDRPAKRIVLSPRMTGGRYAAWRFRDWKRWSKDCYS